MEEKFQMIYEEIYNSCKDILEEVKNKNNRFLLKVLFGLIILNLILYLILENTSIIFFPIVGSIAVILILIVVGSQNYRKIYKKEVINSIVKGYNKNLKFEPSFGISRMNYKMSDFDRNFDDFSSEDRIFGKLNCGATIELSEIITYKIEEYTDANGERKEEKSETYRGMFGIIRLEKNLLSSIYISGNSFFQKYNKDRIEVDSAEFENYYDIITKDKVMAMRIYTADLIEKYVEIIKNTEYPFELKIEDNIIYFRYKCGKMFEPPSFSTGIEKEFLFDYYKLIYYPLEAIEKTIENINEILN